MIDVINKRKIWYGLSLVLIVASLITVFVQKVPYGIDFTGGSLMEIQYDAPGMTVENIQKVLESNEIDTAQVQTLDNNGFLIRMPEINEDTRKVILSDLRRFIGQEVIEIQGEGNNILDVGSITIEATTSGDNTDTEGDAMAEVGPKRVDQLRFESVGPVIGSELKSTSIKAMIYVLLAILFYVAWAFRKVSWPVSSWKYGATALITLFHDVVITFGAFVFLSNLYGWEVNTAYVAAILTILGYSVNDTIVVFDRIRENVPRLSGTFDEVVNTSVNQTMSRSINTSLTTLLVLVAILIFGGSTLQPFVATLIIGVLIGTYSSIFIASPLLVSWQKISKKS